MKQTFHLFSVALVMTLIVSLVQATSTQAGGLPPTPTPTPVDPGPTPTQVIDPGDPGPTPTPIDPGPTPTRIPDWPPTFTPVAPDFTPTPVGGTNLPMVIAIVVADPSRVSATSVYFAVIFSKPVIGVDTKDFILKRTGWVFGAMVSNVSGSGNIYTVTVRTGIGRGTLRLDVPIHATVMDLSGNPLGSLPFNRGEVVSVNGYWR